MRRFKVVIETPFVNGEIIEYFEVENDATEEEIAAEAKDVFHNSCNYGFSEVFGDDE
jgi:hypothetical protein